MTHTQNSISPNRTLARIPVPKAAAVVAPKQTDHVLVVDCSGSMYGSLDSIRLQLKNKLASLIAEGDTITIIAFSGRGECYTVVEGQEVHGLRELGALSTAIDRWLKPLGLTGFVEPLQSVESLPDRLAKLRASRGQQASPLAMLFVTDGHDNQWSPDEIMKAASALAARAISSTFVEFGWYCNRPQLVQMAEKAGGSLIFAEDFQSYAPVFEKSMHERETGAPRVALKLGDLRAEGGFVMTFGNGEVRAFAVDEKTNEALVPADSDHVWAIVGGAAATSSKDDVRVMLEQFDAATAADQTLLSAAYAAVHAFAMRARTDVVFDLLRAIGDVELIQEFGNCYTKQQYSGFQTKALGHATAPDVRFKKGKDHDAVPADDAFTVLDTLKLLGAEKENCIRLDHKEFDYERIGRKQLDAKEFLTEAEQTEVDALFAKARSEGTASSMDAATKRMNEILKAKPKPATFTAKPKEGVPVRELTLNENRANVSVLVRIEGDVELPKNKVGLDCIASHIFRNYAIIVDGVVNMKRLPVTLGKVTFDALKARDLVSGNYSSKKVYVVDISELPTINRKMVKQLKASESFREHLELLELKAAQKVVKYYSGLVLPRDRASELKAAVQGHSDEQLQFLSECGVTSNGFAPKRKEAKATDVYLGYELPYKAKGLSSLPSVKDVVAKMKEVAEQAPDAKKPKKLTVSEQFIAKYISNAEAKREEAQKSGKPDAWVEFIRNEADRVETEMWDLYVKVCFDKFCVLAGRVWYSDFASRDENKLTVKTEFGEIEVTAEVKETQIEV